MSEMAPRFKHRRLSPAFNAAAATATPSLDRLLTSTPAMVDPAFSIGLSQERILHSSPLQPEKEKENLINNTMLVGSALVDCATRWSERKFAAAHNLAVWPLPLDLTIKVFTMLDTASVCYAAATCSLFNKCASDPLCYANIDLTSSTVNVSDTVVSTVIQRAGENFRSIKVGRLPQDKKTSDKAAPTWSCLSALDGGAAARLCQLHLYNLEFHDYYHGYRQLCLALSVCQSLVELEIVGLDISSECMLSTIFEHCHLIERMCLDNRAIGCKNLLTLEGWEIKNLTKKRDLKNMTRKCPRLSSLALKGCLIEDNLLSDLIKEACGIKSLNLLGSFGFSGTFLRDRGGGADSLETLILCDCSDLRAEEVSVFLSAILFGDWKALRYVDISNSYGLIVHHGFSRPRSSQCALDVSQIIEERPDIQLVANFPPEMPLSPPFFPHPFFRLENY